VNQKELGAAPATPSSTETWTDNYPFRDVCQAPGIKTRASPERGGKKGHFYKPIATQFRHDGFNFRQIVREGDVAIYEQTWTGCADPSICYEVVRIRQREGFQVGGNFVEPAEVYPRSEAWGTDGFTLTDKDAAFNKFRQMSPVGPAPTWNSYGDVLDLEQTETSTQLKHEIV
jgi:hypothetical protein